MKIKHSNKKRNLAILSTLTVFFLGLAAYAVFFYTHTDKSTQTNTTTGHTDTLSNEVKEQADSPDTAQNTSKNPVESTDSENKTTSPDGSPEITITALNQSGDVLQVRALINELWTDGQCALTLSKSGSNSIVKYAKTQPLSSQSTCAGFNVDTSQMDKGTWNVKITVTKDDQTATVSKDIEIN